MITEALYAVPAGVLFFVVMGCVLISCAAGYEVGRRRPLDPKASDQVAIVQNSILGLMAFLLGFAFSFGTSRLESRLDLEQVEACAMGTAWLRADLLDNPYRGTVKRLMVQYVDARLSVYLAGTVDADAIARAESTTNAVQDAIWRAACENFSREPNVKISLVVQAINSMFDAAGTVQENLQRRTPLPLYLLLVSTTVIGGGFIGLGFGRAGRRSIGAWLVFALCTSLVLYVVLEFTRPERGLFRASHASIMRVKQEMSEQR